MWIGNGSCKESGHKLLTDKRNMLLSVFKGSALYVIQNGGKVKDATVIAICLLWSSRRVYLKCP